MPPARPSSRELTQVAELAGRAPDPGRALETVVHEIGRVFQSEAYGLERVEHQWSVAATTPQAPPLSRALLEQLTAPESFAPAAHRDPAGRNWVVISLATPWTRSLALLLPGECADSEELLSDWARLTAFAIGAIHERESAHACRATAGRRLCHGAPFEPARNRRPRRATHRGSGGASAWRRPRRARAAPSGRRLPDHRRHPRLCDDGGRAGAHPAGQLGDRPRLFDRAARPGSRRPAGARHGPRPARLPVVLVRRRADLRRREHRGCADRHRQA